MILCEKAQVQSSSEWNSEWTSIRLWMKLWTKHLFTEEDWLVCQEMHPEGSGRRRVDITIEYVREKKNMRYLLFMKQRHRMRGPKIRKGRGTGIRCLYEVSRGAPRLEFVYAFTSFGTKIRAWRCGREDHYLTPYSAPRGWLNGAQYSEIHSSNAHLIRQAVQMMRAVPPTL